MRKGTEKNHDDGWLKAFLDRERPVDMEALAEALRKPENEKLAEEFRRLRTMKDLSPDEQEIWEGIQLRLEQRKRIGWRRMIGYVAVAFALVCVGGSLWLLSGTKNRTLPQSTVASAGICERQGAYLLLDNKRQVPLSGKKSKKLRLEQGVDVRIDSAGKVSYQEMAEETGLKKPVYHTLVVARAGEYYLELNDGTRVWLNAASELCYPVAFAGDERRVKLKGEGYFEVARDTVRPFLVETGDMTVRVLGTSFNVNAYRDHGNVLTTLVSGKVDILDEAGKSLVVLQPEEQADFRNGQLTVSRVEVEKSIGWLEGKFYFRNMPLEDIMLQLQRWYDVEIFWMVQDLKEHPFSGIIERDLTLEEILATIEKTTHVKFGVGNRCVTVNYR